MDFLPEIIEGRMKGVWQLRGSFFFFSLLSAAIFNLKNFDFLFYVLFIFFLFFYKNKREKKNSNVTRFGK